MLLMMSAVVKNVVMVVTSVGGSVGERVRPYGTISPTPGQSFYRQSLRTEIFQGQLEHNKRDAAPAASEALYAGDTTSRSPRAN